MVPFRSYSGLVLEPFRKSVVFSTLYGGCVVVLKTSDAVQVVLLGCAVQFAQIITGADSPGAALPF